MDNLLGYLCYLSAQFGLRAFQCIQVRMQMRDLIFFHRFDNNLSTIGLLDIVRMRLSSWGRNGLAFWGGVAIMTLFHELGLS